MKKVKKDAASFQQLDAAQMQKINGGFYVNFRLPNGQIKPVWFEEELS